VRLTAILPVFLLVAACGETTQTTPAPVVAKPTPAKVVSATATETSVEPWKAADPTVPPPPLGEVEGRVLDVYARPVAEVSVLADQWKDAVVQTDGVQYFKASGADEVQIPELRPLEGDVGRFHLKGPTSGPTVDLIVRGAFGDTLAKQTVKVGDRKVVKTVRLGRTLVVAVEGKDARDVCLVAKDGRRAWRTAYPNRPTRFVGLSDAERYDVFVPAARDGRYGLLEDVAADGSERVVPMADGEPITGTLALPADLKRDSIEIHASRGRLAVGGEVLRDGSFRFRGLPKGEWTVTATTPGVDPPWRDETKATTGATEVKLSLHRQ
jgi:hypothetical protein